MPAVLGTCLINRMQAVTKEDIDLFMIESGDSLTLTNNSRTSLTLSGSNDNANKVIPGFAAVFEDVFADAVGLIRPDAGNPKVAGSGDGEVWRCCTRSASRQGLRTSRGILRPQSIQ